MVDVLNDPAVVHMIRPTNDVMVLVLNDPAVVHMIRPTNDVMVNVLNDPAVVHMIRPTRGANYKQYVVCIFMSFIINSLNINIATGCYMGHIS